MRLLKPPEKAVFPVCVEPIEADSRTFWKPLVISGPGVWSEKVPGPEHSWWYPLLDGPGTVHQQMKRVLALRLLEWASSWHRTPNSRQICRGHLGTHQLFEESAPPTRPQGKHVSGRRFKRSLKCDDAPMWAQNRQRAALARMISP
jgi:hypothetical protein